MFCTYCGQTNADEARFCQRCGAPFAATTNRLAQPPITFAPPPPGTEIPRQPDTGMPAQPQGPLDSSTQETDPKAIASLVSSLVFFLFPLTQIAGIVLGHLSRADIRRSGGRKKGEAMALAGLIIGYVQVALLPVVLIVAAIAIPNLIRAKQAANEASAVQNVRRIVQAEMTVHTEKNAYTCDAEDFSDSSIRNFIGGKSQGYTFGLSGCTENGFEVIASPIASTSGRRTFCGDESGEIKYVDGTVQAGEATARTCLQDGKTLQ